MIHSPCTTRIASVLALLVLSAAAAIAQPAQPDAKDGDAKDLERAARLAFVKKNYGEAEAKFRKAIELDPKFAKAYSGLATVQIALRNFDGAADSYRKAIELEPDKPGHYSNLGQMLRQKKDVDRSRSQVRHGLRQPRRSLSRTEKPRRSGKAPPQGRPHARSEAGRRRRASS